MKAHQTAKTAPGISTIQARVHRPGGGRNHSTTAAASRNPSATGCERTDARSSVAASRSPRRSRRSSASSEPRPAAIAISIGMRIADATTPPAAPKSTSNAVGKIAARSPILRRVSA